MRIRVIESSAPDQAAALDDRGRRLAGADLLANQQALALRQLLACLGLDSQHHESRLAAAQMDPALAGRRATLAQQSLHGRPTCVADLARALDADEEARAAAVEGRGPGGRLAQQVLQPLLAQSPTTVASAAFAAFALATRSI